MTLLFNQGPHWRLIFWVSYSVWGFMELWLIRRDARPVQGENRDRGSRYAFMLLLPVGLVGAFLAPAVLPQANITLSARPTFDVAIACIWAGVALRFWAVSTLGRFFRTSVVLQAKHELIHSGPYRLLRHPSYTGILITMTGMGLAIGNWLSVFAAVGCMLIAVAVRIRVEERALAERFAAEFAAHKHRTWAVLPLIW